MAESNAYSSNPLKLSVWSGVFGAPLISSSKLLKAPALVWKEDRGQITFLQFHESVKQLWQSNMFIIIANKHR